MPPVLEVGRVRRAHGLHGEVVVEFFGDRPERAAVGARFTVTSGQTLVVEQVRPFQGFFLVRFAGVGDRAAAEALRGALLHARGIEDPNAMWVHELVGSDLVLEDGRVAGRVAGVVANPASDLLELEDGRLVPVRFVVSHVRGRVTVAVPDGLLE